MPTANTLDDILGHIADFTLDAVVISAVDDADPSSQRLIWCNRAFIELTGYRFAEIEGCSPRMFQGPDTDPQVRDRIRRALRQREPIREEVLNYHKDGTALWIDLSISPIADDEGCTRFWVAILRNITRSKNNETRLVDTIRQLRQSEAQLAASAEGARLGLWRLNPQTGDCWFNDIWFTMLGYEANAFAHTLEAFTSLLHPDDRPATLARVNEHLQGDCDMLDCDFRMRNAAGGWTWIASVGRVMDTDIAGRPTLVCGTHSDLTDRKRIETNLQRAAEEAEDARTRVQRLADNAPGGLYELLMPPDGSVEFCFVSSGFLRLFGLTEDTFDANAETLFARVHSEDRQRLRDSIESARQSLTPWRERFRVVIDDTVRWIEANAQLTNAGGGTVRWYGYQHDVTEEVARKHELMQARTQAEAANDAKSAFLANMSHEIRTPLNGVLGFAQVMARTELDAGQREMLANIEEAGQSLLTLLNDILDFSRIEARKIEVKAAPFDLPQLCERVRRIYALQARDKGLDFAMTVLGSAGDYCRGDESRVRQILHNLISNAIKFTTDGHVTVVIGRDDADPEFVEIVVTDSGCGIAEENLETLFDRFTQVDNTLSRSHSGTGLGLAITKGLLDVMDGTISVESEPGQGSAFRARIRLPATEGPADRASSTAAQAAQMATTASGGVSGLHVLCAEDNALNRTMMAALFRSMGVVAAFAENGAEALERFRSVGFDIVLVDVQMPVMDGIDCYHGIRAWEAAQGRAPTPVIALTGNALDSQLAEYRRVGFDDCLTKPVNRGEVERCLAAATYLKSTSGWLDNRPPDVAAL